jgi:hypothetical protein
MVIGATGLQSLVDFVDAVETKKRARVKPEWQPLNLEDLKPGKYLACDQSLAATGLVMLWVTDEHKVYLQGAGRISTSQGTSGWEMVLQSALSLEGLMAAWIRANEPEYTSYWAVHEAPPVGGGRFLKPELSLVSALAFRMAVGPMVSMLPMVRRQDHAKLICGNGNASKTEHHAALKELFPQIVGSDMVTNEATRDALSVGLMAAHRLGGQIK